MKLKLLCATLMLTSLLNANPLKGIIDKFELSQEYEYHYVPYKYMETFSDPILFVMF